VTLLSEALFSRSGEYDRIFSQQTPQAEKAGREGVKLSSYSSGKPSNHILAGKSILLRAVQPTSKTPLLWFDVSGPAGA
jgi:hypothetical protein